MRRLISRQQCAAIADWSALALAAVLPWSTSGTAIMAAILAIAVLGAIECDGFVATLRRPEAYLPVLLVGLFALGMVWASDVGWKDRLHGLSPWAKFLVIPLLLYHFQRSTRGLAVACTFFWSCVALMALSWLFWLLGIRGGSESIGVPVKNYIDQGQEFSLSVAGALWWIAHAVRRRRYRMAVLLGLIVAAFVLNMVFVVSSRTALLTIPLLMAAYALSAFPVRRSAAMLAGLAILGSVLWASSPYLRGRVGSVVSEADVYLQNCSSVSSLGERLEFWRRSVVFIRSAPLIGNGTGTIRHLFAQSARDADMPFVSMPDPLAPNRDLWAQLANFYAKLEIGNPHQQALAVGIQLGAVGMILLIVMWLGHLRVFVPPSHGVAWLGFAVVLQNIITSLANSHLIDFTPGWMYVIGVGMAGGTLRNALARHRLPGHPSAE